MATKAKVGRPTDYNDELAVLICNGLSDGKSLRTVCEEEGMPVKTTVLRWLQQNEGFQAQYARAKQESSDAMADEVLDIVDDGRNDWMEDQYMKGKTPGWKVNGEAVQRSKLRVDTRIWLMSKMKPKKYGDKLDVTSGGKELPTPILGVVLGNKASKLTEAKTDKIDNLLE